MSDEDVPVRDRFWLVVAGLLLVTMPAVTLAVAYTVLWVTRSALVEQVTPLELLELYVVELVAFTAFSYLLYRLTRHAIQRQRRGLQDTPGTARAEEVVRDRS